MNHQHVTEVDQHKFIRLLFIYLLIYYIEAAVGHRTTGTKPFHSQANSLSGAKFPIGPWPTHSLEHPLPELSFPGTFASLSKLAQELSFPVTFVLKTFVLRNFRSLLICVIDLRHLL